VHSARNKGVSHFCFLSPSRTRESIPGIEGDVVWGVGTAFLLLSQTGRV